MTTYQQKAVFTEGDLTTYYGKPFICILRVCDSVLVFASLCCFTSSLKPTSYSRHYMLPQYSTQREAEYVCHF